MRGRLVVCCVLLASCGRGVDSIPVDAGDAAEPHDAGSTTDVAPHDVGEDTHPPVAFDDSPVLQPLGGAATHHGGAFPFATLVDGVPIELFEQASRGREFFVADWEPNDSGRDLLNGLGPMFHAASCAACHPSSGRPPSLLDDGRVAHGLLFRLQRVSGGEVVGPDPVYGAQFQPHATAGVRREGDVRWRSEEGSVVAVLSNLGYGELHHDTFVGARLLPHLTGMGLLDRVDDAQLLERHDPDDLDGDGISGRASWLDAERTVLGRYGWKATVPTLEGQIAEALRSDMGITSPLAPADDCTDAQQACRAMPSGGDPEIDAAGVAAISAYLHLLAVPARDRANESEQVAGYRQFVKLGCETCHRATLQTRAAETDALQDQTIHPFTDLLLHDMGPALADRIPSATASEWRTPPLWGIGRVAQDPAARFLHDGRASTLDEAIRAHGGEAQQARQRYESLDEQALAELMAFLNAL